MKLIKKTFYRNWQECWLIFRYHRRPAIGGFLLTVIIAIIAAIDVERSYEAIGKIKLQSEDTISFSSLLNTQTSFNSAKNTLEERKLFFTSASLVEQVIEELNLNDVQQNLLKYDQLIENLTIIQDLENKTLNIAYTSNNINQSKSVVDFLIDSYVKHQLKINQENLIAIKNKLIERLASAEVEVRDSKIELNKFLKKIAQGSLKPNATDNFAKLSQIEQQITDAKNQIKQIDQKIKNLRFQLGIDRTPIAESDSPLVSDKRSLLDRNFQASQEIIDIKTNNFDHTNLQKNKITLARHPTEPEKKLLELTEELINYEGDKRIWLSKIEAWENSQKIYHNSHKQSNLASKQQYQDLLSKSEAAENKYKTLLIRLHQLEIISKQRNVTSIQTEPIIIKNTFGSWNKEIIVVSGIGLGLLLGFGTAFTVDRKNPSLKTSESICRLCNTNLLGKIPNLKKFGLAKISNSQPTLPERSVLEAPYSVASEAYKIVYQNLQHNKIKKKLQTITISSADSQEGKSTFAANFAASTAQLGKKVLLIDTNFYEPRQHEIWQLPNHLGLTDLLKNNAKLENIVQSPSLNIDVITTGFVFGDGLSLLQSETMKQLVNYIKQKYDVIIFDTPSINLYPNALTINKFTDGMILVGKTGVTSLSSVMRTKELIDKSQQVVLGLVVNDKMTRLKNLAKRAEA
ncbi:MAG: polysaccharide biosynthesis tyrosine autokinase [Xenococcaceae cyanobacterium MO_188.B19]|nr:polysaccharide biosynthesis tyrosine autokinase [Xenococcaceae cyanobacterium MO_188.B19]